MDFERYDRIRPIRWEGDHLSLLDQRRLPFVVEQVACRDSEAVGRAIHDLVVRGAPAIGIAAAWGAVLAAREVQAADGAAALVALAPALAEAGHPVWALDLPAYGYSAREPFPGTAGEALGPWLAARHPGPWCLLGHSMGTRVVAELVQREPARVAAVAYVSGNPIPSARELRNRERFSSPRVRAWFAGIAERRYLRSDRIARLLERAYGREPTAEEVEGYFAPLRRLHAFASCSAMLASGWLIVRRCQRFLPAISRPRTAPTIPNIQLIRIPTVASGRV